MFKPKIIFYSAAGCGGCEEAIIDLGEELLKIANKTRILFWPIALDHKYDNLKKCDVSFVNGAITLKDHEEKVKSLRENSKLVVATGSCACFGGIPGLANFKDRDTFLRDVSLEGSISPSIEEDALSAVKPLDQVIEVDYYLPGCPPPADLL